MLVAAPTNSDASPTPCRHRSGKSPHRESTTVHTAVAAEANSAPRTIVARRPWRSANRPSGGRINTAARLNTARFRPMSTSLPPSCSSIRRGSRGIITPMYMNNANAAAVTRTNGLVSMRCSIAFSTGAVTLDHPSRRLLRQTEDAFADDVALDLAGATPDRLAAAEQERAHHRADGVTRPAPVANGTRPRTDAGPGVHEHRGRPEDVEGQFHRLF